MTAADPEYFSRLAKQQSPRYLWIGCSDSRVPANVITGLPSGEIFVHRNIANVVNHTDLNCLSVVQFAVEELQVEHIIVCGHYGCGGVAAALNPTSMGIADNWLRHIRDVAATHQDDLLAIDDADQRRRRLCELNAVAQVENLCHSTIVQNAWKIGRPLHVHGWIYAIEDGLLKDLGVSASSANDVPDAYRIDTATLWRRRATG